MERRVQACPGLLQAQEVTALLLAHQDIHQRPPHPLTLLQCCKVRVGQEHLLVAVMAQGVSDTANSLLTQTTAQQEGSLAQT